MLTIFTPTFNRAYIIKNLYDSLTAQSNSILNEMFTGRPYFTLLYLHTVTPITFFFGDAKNMSSELFYVDSSHVHLLFEGGIFFYIFFYVIYVKAIKYYLITTKSINADFFLPVVFSSMIVGLTECTLLEISMVGNILFWAILFNYAYKYDQLRIQSTLPY